MTPNRDIRMSASSKIALALAMIAPAGIAHAQIEQADPPARDDNEIVVSGYFETVTAGTKTDTPLIEVPQPVSVVPDDIFLDQGSLNIAETLRYVSGVQSSAYGLDSRVDSQFIRAINPVQYRDGMRELFGFYNSIPADPYAFSRVEVVRGPASVLFGQGSIGGLINLVSKKPEFAFGGEVSVRYGSFDRKEVLADITGPISDTVAVRLTGRLRDSNTQTDFVTDDRLLIAPSITWQPTMDTSITLIGNYQEDDGGSVQQFLPLNAVISDNEPGSAQDIDPNPNGRLPFSTFIGEPGDPYDGRILSGTALLEHRFNDVAALRSRVRYIDSDINSVVRYPNNYSNPFNPFLDADQRIIGRYSAADQGGINVLSADTGLGLNFNTGAAIRHELLVGVDYLWNETTRRSGFAVDTIDLYADTISNGFPAPALGDASVSSQEQLGIYAQDQISIVDRVHIVIGGRKDWVDDLGTTGVEQQTDAFTWRAGIIGELAFNVHPFFSYTESFLPVAGFGRDGNGFRPQRGKQFEIGAKWRPDSYTLVTVTGYDITEQNRLINDPADPTNRIQAGELQSRGVEFEARRILPGNFTMLANYSYNEAELTQASAAFQIGEQLENVPKHNASLWLSKLIPMDDWSLELGGGARYAGENFSRSAVNIVRTPDVTTFDAFARIAFRKTSIAVNATNLTDERYPAACLARGDCFLGAVRNVFITLTQGF